MVLFCWLERKSRFIQEVSNLGRWYANALRPSPSGWLGERGFKGSVGEGAAGSMNSLWTILRLVEFSDWLNSQIGWYQGKGSGIGNPLTVTGLGST